MKRGRWYSSILGPSAKRPDMSKPGVAVKRRVPLTNAPSRTFYLALRVSLKRSFEQGNRCVYGIA